MRLLLVEDDAMIGESVRTGLQQDGFALDWVQDGRAAELALETNAYDTLLLDLGLPHKSGLDVLASLRRRGDSIPVLILTARDAVAYRVKGLDAGADDYLVKPFDLEELAARVRALLRRKSGRADPVVQVGNLVDNAIRYTPAGGTVDVALRVRDRKAVMEISDTGPGIPEEDRARVFDRFYRREATHASGSGLGLAIVKNVADRHGTAILLEHRVPAPGLRVSATFPLL